MAFMDEFILPLAFTLDLTFGDPRWMFHPVKGIGWFAEKTETFLRRTNLPLRIAGIFAVIIVEIIMMTGPYPQSIAHLPVCISPSDDQDPSFQPSSR